MLSIVFSTSVGYCKSPSDVLKKLNQTLFEAFRGSNYGLVSAFVGCIDESTLQYSSAGHPYPVFFKKSTNSIEELLGKGFLLGMFENTEFDSATKDIDIQSNAVSEILKKEIIKENGLTKYFIAICNGFNSKTIFFFRRLEFGKH